MLRLVIAPDVRAGNVAAQEKPVTNDLVAKPNCLAKAELIVVASSVNKVADVGTDALKVPSNWLTADPTSVPAVL